MYRRNFITLLVTATSSLTFIPRQIFAKLHRRPNLHDDSLQQSGRVTVRSEGLRINQAVQLMTSWGYSFLSMDDFAHALNFGIYTNEPKKKCVLYVEKDRLTFTADNTFVKFNDQTLQVPLESIWYNEELWVPLTYLVQIIDTYTPFSVSYDPDQKEIRFEPADVNITGVRIAAKENGTLIDVLASRKFKEKDVIVDIRNGWLHIDVYGAKIDPASIKSAATAGIISQIQAFQMDETASLSFKLKRKVLARDLAFDETTNDFHVNLRTKEVIAENEEREKIKDELEERKKLWKIDTIVLDAGHGGQDPGAIGYSKVQEKDLVLSMTLALGRLIQSEMPDVKVVYTRKKDVFIPLWKRTKIANDVDAKLFISIHCNSNPSSRPTGYETYFISADKDSKAKDVVLKENSAIEYEASQDQKRYEGVNFILATMLQSENMRRSQFLASEVQNALKSKLSKIGMSSRGVNQGPFWVLVGATMPNILVETGYISNKYEEKLLRQSTTQKKIAEGIFNGIHKYKEDVENAI